MFERKPEKLQIWNPQKFNMFDKFPPSKIERNLALTIANADCRLRAQGT